MKAILMTAVGSSDVLVCREVPAPIIECDTQILVKLQAAGVNPVDTKLRSRGTYCPEQLPTILGCDGAGIVEQVGNTVTRLQAGDEVFFCFGGIGCLSGNYAEYIVIEEICAAIKPKIWNFYEAAAAPLVCITAWEALFDRGRLTSDSTVLIHAGAGGVGHVAIQLAIAAGARVITTVSNQEKANFVKSLGVERVIIYRDHNWLAAVLDWTNGNGVDLAFDTVGGNNFTDTFNVVKIYGDLVTILQPDNNIDWSVARNRNLRISLELMLIPMHLKLYDAINHQRHILEQCANLANNGKLKIHVANTIPLEQVAAAHQLIQSGGMIGKLVLTI